MCVSVCASGLYWNLSYEYCKLGEDDVLCRVTVTNCAKDAALPAQVIDVLPTWQFRNNWSWGYAVPKPKLSMCADGSIDGNESHLGDFKIWAQTAEGAPPCEGTVFARVRV